MHKFRMTRNLLNTTAIILLASSPSFAKEANAEVAKNLARFGVSIFSMAAAGYDASSRAGPSFQSDSPIEISRDARLLTEKYKAKVKEAQAAADMTQALGQVVISSSVALATTTGVGAVPAILIGSAATWGNEQFAGMLRRDGQEKAANYLSASLKNWDETKGYKYEDVRAAITAGRIDDALTAFDQSTGFLKQVRDHLRDDPQAKDAAEGLLLDTMMRSDRASLEAIAVNTTDISSLQDGFVSLTKFVNQSASKTETRLDTYGARLGEVGESVSEASNQINALMKTQESTSAQLNAMRDVLFDQQPPAGKIFMLTSGAKPGLSDEQRTSLIKLYTAEQKRDELISSSGKFMSSVKEVRQIAANLHLDIDPKIDAAIGYVSAAQSALVSAATGNYLGAIVAVTGVFGGSKPDPEQERFNAIMGSLKRIEGKLDDIIKIQEQTLEAIANLSEQVSVLGQRIDQRFDKIDFQLKGISDNLKSIMWKDFGQCILSYQRRNDEKNSSFDKNNLQFINSIELTKFLSSNSADAIGCARKLHSLFASVKQSVTFGQPLSLRFAANTDFIITQQEQGRVATKTDIESFLVDIHTPSHELIFKTWNSGWGNVANVFALLSSPGRDLHGNTARISQMNASTSSFTALPACSANTLLAWRLRSLLCSDQELGPRAPPISVDESLEAQASQKAGDLLHDPIVRDQLEALVQWTGLVARPYDFWSGDDTNAAFTFQDLGEGKGEPRGKSLIWNILTVLDLSIAQQSLIYGDFTARKVYEFGWDKNNNLPFTNKSAGGTPELLAYKLLRRADNPWLARNVLMYALNDTVLPKGYDYDASIAYGNAMSAFTSVKDAINPSTTDAVLLNQGTLLMKGLFKLPPGVSFGVSDARGVRNVFVKFDDVTIDMPSVEQFRERRFVYPDLLTKLMALRSTMCERFADYEVFDQEAETVKAGVAKALFVGMAQQSLR